MNEEISRIDINNVSYNLKDEETRTLSEMGKQSLIKIGYYECSSEASSASKTIAAPNYVLGNGGSMKVKMTNANSANNATLNINSTGAKALYYSGERASANNSWEAGETIEVYYDGINYYANNVAGGSGGDGVFDVTAKTGDVYATLGDALTAANSVIPANKKKGGMSIKFVQGTVQSSDNKYVQYRLMSDTFNTTVANWQGVDDEPTAGSENLITSGAVAEIINGENGNYDPTVLYLILNSISNNFFADLRSVWDDTNIKNEESGTCTIDWGSGAVPITSRDSFVNYLAAGKHTVAITGITSLNGNTLMRESQILIDAKIPNTLTAVNKWLFNGVSMNEVTFMAEVPPVFSDAGQSINSLNKVTKIKVPKSALTAYEASTMPNAMKAKLEGFDEGINGDIKTSNNELNGIKNNVVQNQNSLTTLTNKVNEELFEYDKTKTYFIIQVNQPTNLDLKTLWNNTNIKNETPGTCFINWGDNSETVTIINDNSLIHNYESKGIYRIEVTGLTGLTSNLLFRGVTYLKSIKFGNTFTNVSTYFMLNNSSVDDVEFFATDPLMWGTTSKSNMNLVNKIVVPKGSLMKYINNWYFKDITTDKDALTNKIYPNEEVDYLYRDTTVTVGTKGDFTYINEAISYLSQSYPLYKNGGIKAIIKILRGTTISEQIYVDGLDLSWITIEYEDYNPSNLIYDNVAESIANGTIIFDTTTDYNSVSVDASSFIGVTHDTRGSVCLFRAENGGRLPIINCVFKLITPNDSCGCAGIVCNRGSEAIVKTLCGFIGFQDGVISNNESSITIREGITMNCSRWGCHARHNGEVSARSVIATGCATNTTYASEYGAAVADRVADMDVREAYLGGNYAIRCHNASSICAKATHVIGRGIENAYLVQATYSGKINASQMTFAGITEGSKMFEVQYAGWIDAFSVTNKTYNVSTLNTIDINGIIFG